MALENLILIVFVGLGLAGIIWRLRRRLRADAETREGADREAAQEAAREADQENPNQD